MSLFSVTPPGEAPQPRPGHQPSQPDGCSSSIMGFQVKCVFLVQRATLFTLARHQLFHLTSSSTWESLPWHSAVTSWTCATGPAGQTSTTVTQSSASVCAASARTSTRAWASRHRSKVSSDVLPSTLLLGNQPARQQVFKLRNCLKVWCLSRNMLTLSALPFSACSSAADALYNTVWTLGCRSYMSSQRAACVCSEEERDELWLYWLELTHTKQCPGSSCKHLQPGNANVQV